MKRSRNRFVEARIKLRRDRPHHAIPDEWFRSGRVLAGGRPVLNPRALIPADVPLVVIESKILRGSRKLAAALNEFQVDVNACVCLDLGASTGGFTQELLNRGARRVYAVDVGHGQLRGVLRQDRRVINLERTNLAELSTTVVPEEIDLMTADLSYIALHVAIGQMVNVRFSQGARLVALVKPQFELGLASAPGTEAEYLRAVALARNGIERAGWRPLQCMRSPHSGAGGAIEYFWLAARS